MKNKMNKSGYVKVGYNKNEILHILINKKNLGDDKFYDMFDKIFENINSRNYVSILQFLIDEESFDLADRFIENCNKINYDIKKAYIENTSDSQFLFAYYDKKYDIVNYFISNIYNEKLSDENLHLNQSLGRFPKFLNYIKDYQRIVKINKIKNKITKSICN